MDANAKAIIDQVVAAYGGAERWRALQSVDVTANLRGTLLRLKLWGGLPPRNMRVRCRVHEPHITLEPIDAEGHVALVDGRDVRLATAKGDVVGERKDAWGRMAAGEFGWRWDAMSLGYFLGQAAWNYLTLPALLLNSEITWIHVGDGRLESRFPPHLPTHGMSQMHTFDTATGLLLRYDYRPELAIRAPAANAAHAIVERIDASGIPVETHRIVRVAPNRGKPLPWPVMVDIRFTDVVYR